MAVLSCYLQLGEGMLKDLDASVLKLSLESGLDNSAILLTDLRYAVQGTSTNSGHKTMYYVLFPRYSAFSPLPSSFLPFVMCSLFLCLQLAYHIDMWLLIL